MAPIDVAVDHKPLLTCVCAQPQELLLASYFATTRIPAPRANTLLISNEGPRISSMIGVSLLIEVYRDNGATLGAEFPANAGKRERHPDGGVIRDPCLVCKGLPRI